MAFEGILEEISWDEFDVKKYTSSILERGISSSYHLSRLTTGLSHIESSITQEVLSKYDILLDDASKVEHLELKLENITTLSKVLLDDVSRIRSKLVRPYELLNEKIRTLERLQLTCDSLRDLSWHLQLLSQLESESDLIRQAEILAEIENLSSSKKLDNVNVYGDTCRSLASWRSKTETEAMSRLQEFLKKGKTDEVLRALHVLHLLGLLKSSAFAVLEKCGQTVRSAVQSATDAERISSLIIDEKTKGGGPGKASMPAPGNTPAFRTGLWQEMDAAAEVICAAFEQIYHLENAVRHSDSTSLTPSFAKLISPNDKLTLLKTFWNQVIEIVRVELKKGSAKSTFVKQSLEGDFPRFLLFTGRIKLQVESMRGSSVDVDYLFSKEDVAGDFFETEESLKALIAPFQNAYLSRSLSRLFDPITFMFKGDTVPPKEEIDTLIAIILSEIRISEKNQGFHQLVSRNVIKCLKLFCVKCEALIISDDTASQVTAVPSNAQKSNGQVFVLLVAFREGIQKHIEKQLSADRLTDFAAVGTTVEALMKSSVDPLLKSIVDSVERILLTMHQENFSAPASTGSSTQCSLYMRELQGFILRVSKDYLSLYGNKKALQPMVVGAASRCFDLFLRHTSLVRPLGEGGKLKMAADFAQMEMAVAPLCTKVSDLGMSYKAVRAFRPMLFLTLADLASSSAIGELVPYSVVMHFMFAQAPTALRSPHQTANWTIPRYCQWLDEHPNEKDRLLLIRGALDAYDHNAKVRKNAKRLMEYDLMIKVMQRGLDSLSQ